MKPKLPVLIIGVLVVSIIFTWTQFSSQLEVYNKRSTVTAQNESTARTEQDKAQRAINLLNQTKISLAQQSANSMQWAGLSDRYDYDDLPQDIQKCLTSDGGIRGNNSYNTTQQIKYNWETINTRIIDFEVSNGLPTLLRVLGDLESKWEALGIETLTLQQQGTSLKMSMRLLQPLEEPIYVQH